MKYLNKIMYAFLLTGIFTSCKKQLLDINVSPNDPTTASATPSLVLANALNTTAGIYNNPTRGSNTSDNNYFAWAAIWLGQSSYSGNYAIPTELLSYALTNNYASGTFTNLYNNIEDYDFVEQKGKTTGNVFYEAIGKFMKAYNFQTLVDLYGNVPYSQALKGTANSYPAYDDAKTIYTEIAKKMDTAITYFSNIANAGSPSIAGDIMFNKVGTTTQSATSQEAEDWLEFANTVKLRLLLRQSERTDRSAYIQTELAKLANATFLSQDATVNPGYLNSEGKMNPFWGSNYNVSGTNTQDFYRGGGYAIQFFKNNNDPRLSKFYQPAEATNAYTGNYLGAQGSVNSQTSAFGPGILKSYDQDAVIMLAAESYFLQAEAVLRGWITGDAKTLYQEGVKASFEYLGLSQASAVTYYTQAGNKQTNWDATTNFQEQLALIIRQKWAAETMINELEPYNDYRRLHLPADVPLSASQYSTGIFPNRLMYPQREYDVNASNVLAQGTITPGTKIWWMP